MFVIVYIDLTFNFDSHSRNYWITNFESLQDGGEEMLDHVLNKHDF